MECPGRAGKWIRRFRAIEQIGPFTHVFQCLSLVEQVHTVRQLDSAVCSGRSFLAPDTVGSDDSPPCTSLVLRELGKLFAQVEHMAFPVARLCKPRERARKRRI